MLLMRQSRGRCRVRNQISSHWATIFRPRHILYLGLMISSAFKAQARLPKKDHLLLKISAVIHALVMHKSGKMICVTRLHVIFMWVCVSNPLLFFLQPSFAALNTNCDLSVHGGEGYKTMVNKERLEEVWGQALWYWNCWRYAYRGVVFSLVLWPNIWVVRRSRLGGYDFVALQLFESLAGWLASCI